MIFLPKETTVESLEKTRHNCRKRRKKREKQLKVRGEQWKGWQSRSIGVHPSDVEKANETLRKKGVTDFRYNDRGFLQADGATSQQAQRRCLKKLGLVNFDDNS